MGALLLALGPPGDPGPAVRLGRMIGRSPHRGDTLRYEAPGIALAVQSLGWDASLARGNGAVVAFHGFVGNLDELGASLGVGFEPGWSHAQIIASFVDELDEGFLPLLRGEFALVVHDLRKERILVARDVAGCRPLYLQELGEHVVIGTEIRQVIAGSGRSGSLSARAMAFHIAGEPLPDAETVFDGVASVTPGEVVSFSRTRDGFSRTQRRYWDFWEALPGNAPPVGEWLEELDWRIARAVTRWIPEHPCAHTLSGGLDASTLWSKLVQMRRDGIRRATWVRPISLVFPGLPCDERDLVEGILERSGDSLLVVDGASMPVTVGRAEAVRWLDSVPFMTSHLLMLLARYAAQDGRLSLISGALGDGLFDIGPWPIRARAAWVTRRALDAVLGRSAAQRVYSRLRGFVVEDARSSSLDLLRSPSWKKEIMERRWTRALFPTSPARVVFNRLARRRTDRSLPGWEQICASQGVEVRHPFSDPDVIVWAAAACGDRSNSKLSKPALREVARGAIPDSVVNRSTKIGFDCLETRKVGDLIDDLQPERCRLVGLGVIDPVALDTFLAAADNDPEAWFSLCAIEEAEAFARRVANGV